MAELQDHQWELGGVKFGLDCRVQHEPDVTPPSYEVRTQDAVNPVANAIRMGRDRKTPTSWAFKLFVDEDSEESALDALDELGTIWSTDFLEPEEVVPLRYRLAGRTRRVYGRPRRWTPTLNNQLLNGYAPITSDFQLVSPLFFDDDEQSIPIDGRPAATASGFEVPFDAPIEFVGDPVPVQQDIQIVSRRPTPILLDFEGPSLNPRAQIGGLVVQLLGIIPSGETWTVDGTPWVQAAYRKDSGLALPPGSVSRTLRFADLMLAKGGHQVIYSHSGTAGQSRVTIRYRNAHSSV